MSDGYWNGPDPAPLGHRATYGIARRRERTAAASGEMALPMLGSEALQRQMTGVEIPITLLFFDIRGSTGLENECAQPTSTPWAKIIRCPTGALRHNPSADNFRETRRPRSLSPNLSAHSIC
ncbi:MAG TPA: hypothetical protein VF086_00795 [Propionibacteriaceae bacterium]